MWKWFKRLIVLVIVVFFAVAALLIPDKIDSQEKCINTNIPCRFSPGGYWWGVPFIRWSFNRD